MSDAALSGSGSDPRLPVLTVRREEQDGALVVALAGELDLGSVGQLEAALGGAIDEPAPHICLDLTELEFIDSTGLAAIIRAHTAVTGTDGRFVVVSVAGPVRRTFVTTGLDGMLSMSDTRAAALRRLAA